MTATNVYIQPVFIDYDELMAPPIDELRGIPVDERYEIVMSRVNIYYKSIIATRVWDAFVDRQEDLSHRLDLSLLKWHC